ncbi:MAG TPA: septum formation initiator family protein [Acidimicrobiales bacterium]|nr:septum formation initiator family protein [Acidimicrobiales bacterium]
MKRAVWPFVGSVVLVAVLAIAIFPTRTYLAQRQRLEATEQRLELLRQQNASMSRRVDELGTDEEVERLAREEYQMVRPGEEAYALLPPPEAPGAAPATPAPAPATQAEADDDDRSLWQRAWHNLTNIF